MFCIPVSSYSSKFTPMFAKSANNYDKNIEKKDANCVEKFDFNFDFQPKISNVSFGCVA